MILSLNSCHKIGVSPFAMLDVQRVQGFEFAWELKAIVYLLNLIRPDKTLHMDMSVGPVEKSLCGTVRLRFR